VDIAGKVSLGGCEVVKATVEMLKGFGNDQAVSAAEKEFTRAQKVEADFLKDFDGLDSA
jgi:hypothetical protein